tara:strand:- start:187 stop:459 length:273 start_codon:yes stop_codon:yes gene_type:complete
MTVYRQTQDGLVALTDEEENALIAERATEANEHPAREARNERNLKLAETDWRAGSDLVLSDEWKAYRQALRDISAQSGFPNDITWPTEPS